MNEKTLLTLNNNSIVLTTHRLVQKTSNSNEVIELKDFIKYEIIKKRHNFYLFLIFLFVLPIPIYV